MATKAIVSPETGDHKGMPDNTANAISEAGFDVRNSCITCGSGVLKELSSGRYSEDPLRRFIDNDPHGENPSPHLRNATWSFVQCEICDQKFHRRILNDEWLNIYYNRWITHKAIEQHKESLGAIGFKANFRIGIHATERMLLLEKLTRGIRGDDPVRVLDFGCGEGKFLSICATCGFECVGVEFSSARKKSKRVDFFPSLVKVAEEHPPGHFHAVVLFEVLEHLSRPLDVLRELRGFVKKGSVLILETPNCETVSGIQTENDYRLIHPLGHINAFTPSTQERIAKEAGFVRISPCAVQCTADMRRVYKREARRFLQPFSRRYTQQVFLAA